MKYDNRKKADKLIRSSAAEYLTYVAAAGENGVELRYEEENIWLTQKMLSVLYGVSTSAINQHIKKIYEDKESEFPDIEQFREIERVVLLKVIDKKWMAHIDDMTQLRQGISLQSYGSKDPRVEYKFAGYDMFNEMTAAICEETVRMILHVRIEQKVEREEVAKVTGTNRDDSAKKGPIKRESAKIGRNDPCPCGSGKKYKQCCGR